MFFSWMMRCWKRQGLLKSFQGRVAVRVLTAHTTEQFCLLLEFVLLLPLLLCLVPTTTDFSQLFPALYFTSLCSASFLSVLPLVLLPPSTLVQNLWPFWPLRISMFLFHKGTPISHHKNDRNVCSCPWLFGSHCIYSLINTQYVLN